MQNTSAQNPAQKALKSCASAFVIVALFSAVVNILMLTGSVYMLQVYDRVLPSQSVPTLVSLSIIVLFLYVVMGVFDWLRQSILSRLGVELDANLSGPVLRSVMRGQIRATPATAQLSRDLDSVRGFLSGLGPTTLFDLPWMPFYAGLCFLLHPLLGWTLVGGGVALISIALLTEVLSRRPSQHLSKTSAQRSTMIEALRRNAEAVHALGMGGRMVALFEKATLRHVETSLRASDVTMTLGAISKTIRFLLQSAMLGVGAWLVMGGQASSGVMIAASVLSSRALAPIEQAISTWRPFVGARLAWGRLRAGLEPQGQKVQVAPARPSHQMTVETLSLVPPQSTKPTLRDISFALQGGDALAVIGPSGSGKSSLARAITGVWPALRGSMRLDGATLDQWPEEDRAAIIGYMPQDVQLFAGSVAENIARFDPEMTEELVRAAAVAAGTYDLIVALPQGFSTQIGEGGALLSGGQRQRIALARALYRDPFLVVLDEPNASLDAQGDAALTTAIQGIRQRGGIVVINAHRPSALAGVNLVLVMADGQIQAFGPKDEVLRKALTSAPAPTVPQQTPAKA